jgi:hypothetical protein
MSACVNLGAALAVLISACAVAAPDPFVESVAPSSTVSSRPLYERGSSIRPTSTEPDARNSDVLDRAPARTAPLPAVAWTGFAMIGGMIVMGAAKRRKQ